MKINYEKYINEISNDKLRNAMTETFETMFPYMIARCEDESVSSKLFISLDNLLTAVRNNGTENIPIDEYMVGYYFHDYVKTLLDLLDSMDSDSWKEDKENVFDVFENVLFETIFELILKGIKNGTISMEELNHEPQTSES